MDRNLLERPLMVVGMNGSAQTPTIIKITDYIPHYRSDRHSPLLHTVNKSF